MTSVPYLKGETLWSNHTSHNDTDQVLSEYSRSSIPPKLLEIRHIKSIIIRHIGSESNYLCKTSSDIFEMKKSKKMDKIFSANSNDTNKSQNTLPELHPQNISTKLSNKIIRKGKSSYNLTKKYDSNTSNISKRRPQNTAIDDNFLSVQAPIVNSSFFEPIEIRRQHESQQINEDNFFHCFYTINEFFNIENPYFISRVFPYYAEIADELEIHVFAKSATVNLYIQRSSNSWKLFKQYHIKLSLLVNLGDDLESIENSLRHINNILLLRLADGCYYILPNESIPLSTIRSLKENYTEKIIEKFDNFQYSETSCSYDQIMTINNLSRCIHDLLHTNQTLDSRISEELKKEDGLHKILDTQNTIQSLNIHLQEVLETKLSHSYQLNSRITQLKKKRDTLKACILQLKYPPVTKSSETCIGIATKTSEIQEENLKLITQINLEKSRIASIIQFIFPMKPIKGKHDFSLFQTCFPASLIPRTKGLDESEHNTIIPISIVSSTIIQRLTQISRPHSERLNSLLGHIAMIVLTVADIFNIPLRYPIRELGSNSYINDTISNFNAIVSTPKIGRPLDDISIAKSTTIYPLFICQNATLAVKFTYALLLLRKNLEQLYEVEGIVKIEEFNLLIACKIWLTCVEGYADDGVDFNEDIVEEDIETLTDNVRFMESNNSRDKTPESNGVDIQQDASEYGDKLSPLLSGTNLNDGNRRISASSGLSKISNPSILSGMSRDSTVSGVSAVSAVSNASYIVSKYNQKLQSEERIKHIKKHLLKGGGDKI
ncbi:hypothetical protein C6P40_004758 [Pichia californica]|uniref:Uncharacterized protein n=1 Tax=Pichia californica TaxID=460514 RepID=A0A9P6WQ08_9ASCO|nr:hypothetical protein C6P42_000423 [[Candida] californica]KAG0691152.1 hypothetical protein C6P40_004758 [[Candida] californica]